MVTPETSIAGAACQKGVDDVRTTTKGDLGLGADGGDKILSPEQLAAYLGIGRTLAYQILAQKRIPSFTIGKLRRVRKSDVDRYVEESLGAEAR
jgi:excisionase family DNA binding protein